MSASRGLWHMVCVKLYGGACKLAGTAEVNLTFSEGMILKEVITQVVGDTGQTTSGVVSAILVNGRNCAFRKGLQTEIADGDVVEMLPLLTGG
jgi:molybdopterin converting factor small subunit